MKSTTKQTLIAVLIVPCLALGAFLGKVTNQPKPKKPEQKKTVVPKRENPLAAYGFTTLSDPKEGTFRIAGERLLTETIQSDASNQTYEELLRKDPVNAYSSILWAYRNSKGIAEKANTLSKFPSDDGYYTDGDVLAEKNTLVAAIADDMAKGKYKSAYRDSNTLNDLLTSFVNRKTAEEKARQEEEERQRQLAIEEQRKAEEAEKAKADAEKKNNANAVVSSAYQTIPQSVRQTFESAGGSIEIVTTDAMPSTANGATVCSDLNSRTIYVNQDTVANDSKIQTEIMTEFAKQINDLKKFTDEPDWQNVIQESNQISGVDNTMTETTDPAKWFEEAFTEYLLYPDAFAQACPNTAKLIGQFFSNTSL